LVETTKPQLGKMRDYLRAIAKGFTLSITLRKEIRPACLLELLRKPVRTRSLKVLLELTKKSLAILLNELAMDDQNPRQCSSPSLDGFHPRESFCSAATKRSGLRSSLIPSRTSPPRRRRRRSMNWIEPGRAIWPQRESPAGNRNDRCTAFRGALG
jgi:hypothetical protein